MISGGKVNQFTYNSFKHEVKQLLVESTISTEQSQVQNNPRNLMTIFVVRNDRL